MNGSFWVAVIALEVGTIDFVGKGVKACGVGIKIEHSFRHSSELFLYIEIVISFFSGFFFMLFTERERKSEEK